MKYNKQDYIKRLGILAPFVSEEVMAQVIASQISPLALPRAEQGWSNDVMAKHAEALALPTVLDSRDVERAGLSRRRRRRDVRLASIMSSPTASVNNETGAESDPMTVDGFRVRLNHFIKGLITRRQIAVKLNIPNVLWETSPVAAMGYFPPMHNGVDEFGLSLTTDDAFPKFIVDAAIKLHIARYNEALTKGFDPIAMKINLNDYLNVVASYPRGKNSGLPLLTAGSDRLKSNITMAINAALATALIKGVPFEVAFNGLCTHYIVFSRYQRSSKAIPIDHPATGRAMTWNFEARRRIINSTVKAVAMAVKPLVKFVTEAHLNFPEFQQDRKALRDRIVGSHYVAASDASRFDLRSGGVKLRQALEVIWTWVHGIFPDVPQTVKDLMFKEAFLPTMIDVGLGQNMVMKHSDKAALRSGASTTSRSGSVINLMYDMYVTAKSLNISEADSLVRYYLKHSPSVIQGDDLLKLFPSQADSRKYIAYMPHLEEVGASAELEHPTRFLGYLVHNPDNADFRTRAFSSEATSADGLYHASNSLDNIMFPEKFSSNPTASFLARYVMLTDRRADSVIQKIAAMMTDDDALKSIHSDFCRSILPLITEFYMSHPSGKARMFFQQFPNQDVDLKSLRIAFDKSVDDVLDIIAHGSQYDFNTNILGVPTNRFTGGEELSGTYNPEDVDYDGDDSLSGSLNTISKLGHNITADRSEDKLGPISDANILAHMPKGVTKEAWIRVAALFHTDSPDQFVTMWRALLPALGREIKTTYGSFFVTNI